MCIVIKIQFQKKILINVYVQYSLRPVKIKTQALFLPFSLNNFYFTHKLPTNVAFSSITCIKRYNPHKFNFEKVSCAVMFHINQMFPFLLRQKNTWDDIVVMEISHYAFKFTCVFFFDPMSAIHLCEPFLMTWNRKYFKYVNSEYVYLL